MIDFTQPSPYLLAQLSHIFSVDADRLFKRCRARIVVLFLLYVVSNAFEVTALALPVFRAVGATDAAVYGVTHFLGNLFNYFSPIAMGNHFQSLSGP